MAVPANADVLVIGGGPAGRSAATLLARRGYDVVLVDKVRHPRETVGESVLPSAWKYFDLLGVTRAVEHEGFVKKAGGVVAWGDEITQISFRDFAYGRPGLHVERAALDYLLLNNAKAAGAQILEGMRAESFITDDAGNPEVALSTGNGDRAQRMRCRFLIDATGQASFTARQFGTKQLDTDFRFVALWGYFTGSRYVSSDGIIRQFEDIPDHSPMTFVSHLGGWGWAWHIPMRKETSVGIVVSVDDYKKHVGSHASLEHYFLSTCRGIEHLSRLLAPARLTSSGVRIMRDYSYAPDRIAGPGYFVIGDAAGFVDPIFSIGVVMALYSGQLAAWAIDRSLQRPVHAPAYRKLFENQMRGRYELARTMALPVSDGAGDAPDGAKMYFDFFSKSEQELMWSAASMTTRSGNLVRTASDGRAPVVLKRRQLDALRFA